MSTKGDPGPLARMLSLKRQQARLADASCLASRRRLAMCESEVTRINLMINEANTQFVDAVGQSGSIAALCAFRDVADRLDDQRRSAVNAAFEAERNFRDAAKHCLHLRREIDVIGKVLDRRREQMHYEADRKQARLLDDLALQQRQDAVSNRVPRDTHASHRSIER